MKNRMLNRLRCYSAMSILICSTAMADEIGNRTYQATELGVVGSTECNFLGMNNHGRIAGGCKFGKWLQSVSSLANGKQLQKTARIGGLRSWASDINSFGTVVGASWTEHSQNYHAWFGNDFGLAVDLGTLGGSNSVATAVNNRGDIIGTSQTAGDLETHLFLANQADGKMQDLGSLGYGSVGPWRINESGVAAGQTWNYEHTRLYAAYFNPFYNQIIGIGTLGGTYSTINDINADNTMVGRSLTTGDTLMRAIIVHWDGGYIRDLNTPTGLYTQANSINDKGQIVGDFKRPSDGELTAFLCSGDCSDFVDLNLITKGVPRGVWLTHTRSINKQGQILAIGSNGTGYLLSPQ